MDDASQAGPGKDGATHVSGDERSASDRFRERFETLLPTIQERWPGVAREALEATRGSFDEVVALITTRTGSHAAAVGKQLQDLLEAAGDGTRQLADSLEPLERQLEQLLDELNTTLRPRIERPVRQRPLLAMAVAAGVGVIVGMLISPARRRSS
jgi:ElaB/YqjD/DUF883 family membrane-anchored ribosome-binding protein